MLFITIFTRSPSIILKSKFSQFDEEGLVISGMKPEEIKELFSKSFLDYFKNNEKYVSSQVSEYVKGIANDIMHGKNLKQLIKWLEDIIHGNIIH